MISKKILSIIVCPLCKGPLKEKDGVYCSRCNKVYPVVHGVPHLLAKDYYSNRSLSRSFEFKSRLRNSRMFRTLKYIFGADFVPYNPLQKFHSLFLDKLLKGGLILNLGSGSTKYPEGVINVDIEHFPNVDIVSDGCQLPFAEETFDAIISEAVIEHVKYPKTFLDEVRRCLKKDSTIFIVAPFIHPFHGYPSDFQRYSIEGLKVLFEDFEEVESGVYRGPSVAFVNFVSDYLAGLFFCKKLESHILLKSIFTLIIFPVKFLDIILIKSKNSFTSAHCVYYIGKVKK